MYDGPYIVQREVRRNAYPVQDDQGNILGTYNSRQMKPHREAKLEPYAEINVIQSKEEIPRISSQRIRDFVDGMMKKNSEANEESKSKRINNDDVPKGQSPKTSPKEMVNKSTSKAKDVEKDDEKIKNLREGSARQKPRRSQKPSREVTIREESRKPRGNPTMKEDLKIKKKLTYRKKESATLTWGKPIRSSTPINLSTSGEEESDEILKKKRSKISEKGMRHVKRLTDMISGKKRLTFIIGRVEQIETRIIMDTRGEFNVITSATI